MFGFCLDGFEFVYYCVSMKLKDKLIIDKDENTLQIHNCRYQQLYINVYGEVLAEVDMVLISK